MFNIAGFGDVNKVKHLQPVLDAGLHADSRMVLDIRKGSGAYPFLKPQGTTETLSDWADGGGGKTTRVV